MTNFQPEQVSDNTAAPSNTSDVNSMQSVYSDLGSSYMRDAASLAGSSTLDNSTKSSTDLQNTLNAGLQTTDQLYGGSPTSGLGVSRGVETPPIGSDSATPLSDVAAPTEPADTAAGDSAVSAKTADTESGDSDKPTEAPSAQPSDLQNAMQRRAEHRSDVVHDRPEMSMARSAGGG